MPRNNQLRSEIIRLASELPKGDPTRRRLLEALRSKHGSKRLSQLTLRDVGEVYNDLWDDWKAQPHQRKVMSEEEIRNMEARNRQQGAEIVWRRARKIIDAVLADDLDTFRKEASLTFYSQARANWYGKVTKAIMDAVGVRNAKNLNDLYEKFQAVK